MKVNVIMVFRHYTTDSKSVELCFMFFRVGLGVPYKEKLTKFYKLSDILCDNINRVSGGFAPDNLIGMVFLQDKLENE